MIEAVGQGGHQVYVLPLCMTLGRDRAVNDLGLELKALEDALALLV